jgi:acetyltransferase-like isoleucine patch superfamily enzyme
MPKGSLDIICEWLRPRTSVDRTARLYGKDSIRLGRRSLVCEYVIIRAGEEPVEIGAFSQIGPFTVILGGVGVKIGDNVMIGPHCCIAAGSHDYVQVERPMRFAGDLSKGPIVVEDNVWIGANVTLTDGVRIGRDAVVGAGSVVTKDVAPYEIVAGAPARVIGNRLERAKEAKRAA